MLKLNNCCVVLARLFLTQKDVYSMTGDGGVKFPLKTWEVDLMGQSLTVCNYMNHLLTKLVVVIWKHAALVGNII